MQDVINSAFNGLIGSVITAIVSFIFFKIRNREIQKKLCSSTAEIKRLTKLLNEFTKKPLVLKNGVYYDTDGNSYCPACYGSPYNRIPLRTLNQQGSWALYQCPKCKEPYEEGKAPQNNPKRYSALDDF
jgi:hypothetical protein